MLDRQKAGDIQPAHPQDEMPVAGTQPHLPGRHVHQKGRHTGLGRHGREPQHPCVIAADLGRRGGAELFLHGGPIHGRPQDSGVGQFPGRAFFQGDRVAGMACLPDGFHAHQVTTHPEGHDFFTAIVRQLGNLARSRRDQLQRAERLSGAKQVMVGFIPAPDDRHVVTQGVDVE